MNIDEMRRLGRRLKSGPLNEQEVRSLVAGIESYKELITLLNDPNTTLDDLAPHLAMAPEDPAAADPASQRSESLEKGRNE